MELEELRLRALRETIRYLAARRGLSAQFGPAGGPDGVRGLLMAEEGGGDVLSVFAPREGAWVSMSLVLVVEESFLDERIDGVLQLAARYDVSVSRSGDAALPPGEVYLHLAQRLAAEPLLGATFDLALDGLRAARDALASSFP